ncbi:hypothetical protein WME94_08325 [Sorangium sp. So ce429]
MSLALLGSASVAAGCSREEWLARQTNGDARIIELVGTPAWSRFEFPGYNAFEI